MKLVGMAVPSPNISVTTITAPLHGSGLSSHRTAISDGAYRPNLGPLNGRPYFLLSGSTFIRGSRRKTTRQADCSSTDQGGGKRRATDGSVLVNCNVAPAILRGWGLSSGVTGAWRSH